MIPAWLVLGILSGCGSPGPKSETQARRAIEARLSDRYGEAFEVTKVEHRPRGLDGMRADRHRFVAHAKSTEEFVFEGLVDFDLKPLEWTDDYPCVRDAKALQHALDRAVQQPRTVVLEAQSLCDRIDARDHRPEKAGNAFHWKIRLATFGGGALEEETSPVHDAVNQVASTVGVGALTLAVDLYERGEETALYNRDHPLSPAMSMWYRGTTLQRAVGSPTEVVGSPLPAFGVQDDLGAWARIGRPRDSTDVSRVYAVEKAHPLVASNPEVPLAELPDEVYEDLEAFTVLAIVGPPTERGAEVRRWLSGLYERIPEGRFYPTVYVIFFDPSIDRARPLVAQPDKQIAVWLYGSSLGMRVRTDGWEGIQPITAIRYAIPPAPGD